jgi:tRNA-2-methylthio-N6-dimethylallyladenosine synthase
MQSYYVWTVGCQMNKADSERLESALGQMGLTEGTSARDADVIVLNSCVVRESAEDRVVGMLTHLKPVKQREPHKVLALMGCMVGPRKEQLTEQFPYVDVFMQPQQYDPLIELLGYRLGIDPEGCVGPLTATPDVTTFIPVIHGCDKFCSFCIIPYRRGREVSRTVDDVVNEAAHLAKRGVKEVTLLGQNVDSYGHDLPGSVDLGNLLAAVNEVEGLERVRFLTSHPNDMSDSIIDAIANLDKVCEHVNLPFQAGDDQVLADMRRGYTNAEYREKAARIRDRIPNVSLATDLIVGFCGETEEQFERTAELVRDIAFDKVHSAAYSTRPGTISARLMQDDVPEAEKQRRLKVIEEIQESVSTEINARLLDTTQGVLVEGQRKGRWFGRNRNDKLVFFDHQDDLKGQMVDVRIERTSPWSLQGSLLHH